MNLFPRNSFLGVVIVVTVLLIGLESGLVVRTHGQARRALSGLEEKRQERDALQRLAVGASEKNERAISLALAEARERLTAAHAALTAPGGASVAPTAPTTSIEAYFDLANFVESTRALAAQAQVALKSDEHFGFSSHAREGPPPELVAAVSRQRIIVRFLVAAVCEARAAALLSVQRERPVTALPRAFRNLPHPTGLAASTAIPVSDAPADFIELAPRLSLRVPGEIDTDAFQLEFSGQTSALRLFLNRLALGELPLVVRSVEVEPAAIAGSFPGERRALNAATPVPIVAENSSRFRIIVELVAPRDEPEGRLP